VICVIFHKVAFLILQENCPVYHPQLPEGADEVVVVFRFLAFARKFILSGDLNSRISKFYRIWYE
jgi:hypothetical protein